MKKRFLSLIAVGLLGLVACDTETISDPSNSSPIDNPPTSSSPIDTSPSTSSTVVYTPEERVAEIVSQLNWAGGSGIYTFTDGTGYVEQFNVAQGWYYVPGVGAGYKKQAAVVGTGDWVYDFTLKEVTEDGVNVFSIDSPLRTRDGETYVTSLSEFNYLSFTTQEGFGSEIFQIDREEDVIFTTDATFIEGIFRVGTDTIARANVDYDYTDQAVTIEPVFADGLFEEEVAEDVIAQQVAAATVAVSDILFTSVSGLSDDPLEIAPAAIDADLFKTFSSTVGSVEFQGNLMDLINPELSREEFYGVINYGTASYSSDIWQRDFGYFGEYYYDDGDGLMTGYIDASTGEAVEDESFADAGYTWADLGIDGKPALDPAAFRYDAANTALNSGTEIYTYWGLDADTWLYDMVMLNVGVPIDYVIAIKDIESSVVTLQAATVPFYYTSNPNQFYQYIFLIQENDLPDNKVPELASVNNDFNSTYITAKLDGNQKNAVQLTGINNMWSVFDGFNSSTWQATFTLTSDLYVIESPFYLKNGFYKDSDAIYQFIYRESDTDPSTENIEVHKAAESTSAWNDGVAINMFPFSGGALDEDPITENLWWAASNSLGWDVYLDLSYIDPVYEYASRGLAMDPMSFHVDTDDTHVLGFGYTTTYLNMYAGDAYFTYKYDDEQKTIENQYSSLKEKVKCAIEKFKSSSEGGDGE